MNDNDEQQVISDCVAGREHAKREREREGERESGHLGRGGEVRRCENIYQTRVTVITLGRFSVSVYHVITYIHTL